MKKINKSEVMKRAWNLFRSNARINTFAEALKKAWAEAKKAAKVTVRYMIADWFFNKNIENFTTAHCICFETFSKDAIIKETEKALFVELEMETKTGADTFYTKKVWIPKSVVSEYAF